MSLATKAEARSARQGAETMRDAYRRVLMELAKPDRNLLCLDSDLGGTEDTFGAILPEQYVNLGIAEANLMLVAAGPAKAGKRIFVNTMAGFATMRAAEQFKLDIVWNELPVTVVATHAGLSSGALGPTHWSWRTRPSPARCPT